MTMKSEPGKSEPFYQRVRPPLAEEHDDPNRFDVWLHTPGYEPGAVGWGSTLEKATAIADKKLKKCESPETSWVEVVNGKCEQVYRAGIAGEADK